MYNYNLQTNIWKKTASPIEQLHVNPWPRGLHSSHKVADSECWGRSREMPGIGQVQDCQAPNLRIHHESRSKKQYLPLFKTVFDPLSPFYGRPKKGQGLRERAHVLWANHTQLLTWLTCISTTKGVWTCAVFIRCFHSVGSGFAVAIQFYSMGFPSCSFYSTLVLHHFTLILCYVC